MSAKHKSVEDPLVRQSAVLALVDHISTLIAIQDGRITELEARLGIALPALTAVLSTDRDTNTTENPNG